MKKAVAVKLLTVLFLTLATPQAYADQSTCRFITFVGGIVATCVGAVGLGLSLGLPQSRQPVCSGPDKNIWYCEVDYSNNTASYHGCSPNSRPNTLPYCLSKDHQQNDIFISPSYEYKTGATIGAVFSAVSFAAGGAVFLGILFTSQMCPC